MPPTISSPRFFPQKKPVFKSRNQKYEIDTCTPQTHAIESGKVNWHGLTKGHYPGALMPKDVLPGLNSIGFWDADGTPDWGEEPHRNEGIEIIFLETGTMGFTVDKKLYHLRAGQFTITRPWQLHKLGAPNIGPGLLHWLILDVGIRRPHQKWRWPNWMMLMKDDLAMFTQKLRHNENPVWNATPSITESFRRIGRSIDSWNHPRGISHLVVHLNGLFLNIFEALSSQQTEETPDLTSPRRTVESFLNELKHDLKICSEQWSKTSMAEHCGLGTTTFSKYCRELVNSGPMEFLNICRLDFASKALKKGGPTITDIALACGFNTSQYFATCFRKKFGCTPNEYRQQFNCKRIE
jgi:AraC family L-rhamnose operon regulatory protein RhaS